MSDRLAFSGLVAIAGVLFFCLGCLLTLLLRIMWPTIFVWVMCCAMLMSHPVTPIPQRAHVLIHSWPTWGMATLVGFLVSLMLVSGLLTAWKLWRATQRLMQTMQTARLPLPPVVARLAVRLNLVDSLVVVPNRAPFSFCYGFRRPRICLSLGLIELLTEAELEAVLWHEAYHLYRREPLRMAMAIGLSRFFFFIPLLAELRDHYLAEKELAADTAAVAHTSQAALAGALHKLITIKEPFVLSPLAAAAGLSVTVRRIDRLMASSVGSTWTPSRRSIWSTLTIFTVGCLLMVIGLS